MLINNRIFVFFILILLFFLFVSNGKQNYMNETRREHPNFNSYSNADKHIIIKIYRNKYKSVDNWDKN